MSYFKTETIVLVTVCKRSSDDHINGRIMWTQLGRSHQCDHNVYTRFWGSHQSDHNVNAVLMITSIGSQSVHSFDDHINLSTMWNSSDDHINMMKMWTKFWQLWRSQQCFHNVNTILTITAMWWRWEEASHALGAYYANDAVTSMHFIDHGILQFFQFKLAYVFICIL